MTTLVRVMVGLVLLAPLGCLQPTRSEAEFNAAVGVDGGGHDAPSTPLDAGSDSTPEDSGPDDSGTVDGALVDAPSPDTVSPDAGPTDTGTPDAGPTDTGTPDAGPSDTGTSDAGPTDTGTPDSGTPDVGPTDTGGPTCAGKPSACDDGVACTVDTCDPTAGCQHTADPKLCDDGQPCTTDTCTPAGSGAGCVHTPLQSGPCDDGDPCTLEETCSGGVCVGPSKFWAYAPALATAERGHSGVALPKGGMMVAGARLGSGGGDALLTRLSATGAASSPTVFNAGGDDVPAEVVRLSGGDVAVVGSVSGGSGKVWARRLDLSGKTVWSTSFGGPTYQILYDAMATPSGGLVTVGTTAGAHKGHKHGWLVQLDAKGKTTQTMEVESSDTTFYGVTQTPGSASYVVCGMTQLGKPTWEGGPRHGGQDGLLAGIDLSGKKILWQTWHGGSRSDALWAVAPVAGGYVAVGGTSSAPTAGSFDHLIVRTDSVGKPLWTRRYGGGGVDMSAGLATNASALFLVGSTNSRGSGGFDAVLMSVGLAKGELRWTRVRGTTGSDSGSAVVPFADGTFAWVGSFAKPGGGSQLRVERFDAQGNFSCGAGCSSKPPCDDGNDCTFDQCDPKTGTCVAKAAHEGSVCTDAAPCLLDGACKAGSCSAAGKRLLQTTFGATTANELFYSAAALGDGGALLGGARTLSGTSGTANGWLRRVDVNGKTRWETEIPHNSLGSTGISAMVMSSVRPDRALAATHANGPKARLFTLEIGMTSAKVLKEHVITAAASGVSFNNAGIYALAPLAATGQYAAVGTAWTSAGTTRGWFIHNAGGASSKQVTWSEPGKSARFFGAAGLAATSAVVVGALSGGGSSQGLVMRWEVDGKKAWVKKMSGFSDISEATTAPDGTIYVVGEAPKSSATGRDVVVARLSAAGAVAWTTPIARPGDQAPTDVLLDGGNHLLISGWTQSGATRDALFARFALGAKGVTAAQVRSIDGGSAEEGISLARSRADFWIAGLRRSGKLADGLLLRVDRWGNTICHASCVKKAACEDGKACTADACSGSTGACSHEAAACVSGKP